MKRPNQYRMRALGTGLVVALSCVLFGTAASPARADERDE